MTGKYWDNLLELVCTLKFHFDYTGCEACANATAQAIGRQASGEMVSAADLAGLYCPSCDETQRKLAEKMIAETHQLLQEAAKAFTARKPIRAYAAKISCN